MSKICGFTDCGKAAFCKGLCPAHYQQQRAGKPLVKLQTQYHGVSEAMRLLLRCDKRGPDECWPFIGSRPKQGWHGQFTTGNRSEPAHRSAWRLFVGEIPVGVSVLHKCDNPICINPAHLFLGSQSDNMKDMWAKGRARPGVVRGEPHGMSKLSAEAVRFIRESDAPGTELAAKYGVTPTTICDVRKRRIWRHIE